MKQVTGLTSTYSSDTFGVCSALYELGGMVVMHDASGCNSTYTTHDEPRWYSMESMIFISALSEKEAVMGDDEKLIRDVTETALKMRPKFIALAGAPIPFMTGTDFKAIAALIERRTGILTFGFDTNGMQGYLTGISMALDAVVRRFCRGSDGGYAGIKEFLKNDPDQTPSFRTPENEEEADRNVPGESAKKPFCEASENREAGAKTPDGFAGKSSSGASKNLSGIETNKDKKFMVNIIGVTPLDFSLNGSVESMGEWLAESGFTPGACLAMGSSLEEISNAGEADVNLVVSYGGLAAARELEKRFGTPWIAGVPVGKAFAAELAEKIKEAAETKRSAVGYSENLTGAVQGTVSKVRSIENSEEPTEKNIPGIGSIENSEESNRGISDPDCGQSVSAQPSDKGSETIEKESSGKSECGKKEIFFIGESIFGCSLARAIELETGSPVRVFCPVETEDILLRSGDLKTPEEDDLMRELSSVSIVIADPLYRRICPPEADFYPLRHVAFSGRLFEETDFNLINREIMK